MSTGKYPHKPSQGFQKGVSRPAWNKGKKLSDKHKKNAGKLSGLARIGIKFTEKRKRKLGESTKRRYDKIGRKQYKRYVHNRDKRYLQWRSDVFQRDNWTCKTCGKRGCYLEAHHNKSWAKYPKLRYKVSNGITLCRECHKLTNNYKNKQYV